MDTNVLPSEWLLCAVEFMNLLSFPVSSLSTVTVYRTQCGYLRCSSVRNFSSALTVISFSGSKFISPPLTHGLFIPQCTLEYSGVLSSSLCFQSLMFMLP